ncbi:uncharacterized protein LOC123442069 [Hordeum vulgare subsp. vulgare]|uniref:Predicted protein n=1 Tax=Hordeum vulgare subsp. vulgare TaxID=112509 RepID=F2ELP2_HORVV|nr:uncharacterized protein LOC123442069 [Hordeum vulgare subsp. vulgare]KAI5018471.1 hypothetical protein ZWY2020_043359 [Hordeum vulgare]BAK08264.1 predicted protein [Hordeum vulgare subsp. vulgare]
MEVEMQLDDDVFFAELSKRISLLITDDDEADFGSAQFPAAVHLPPGFSMSSMAPHVPSMLAPPAYTLFHHAASYGANNSAGDAGRTWQQQQPQQQQCGSKGTGVFIPRSTPGSAHPKRKGRNWSGSKAAVHKAKAQAQAQADAPVKRKNLL